MFRINVFIEINLKIADVWLAKGVGYRNFPVKSGPWSE